MIEYVNIFVKIALTLVNTCGLILALCVFARWMQRIERKQDQLQEDVTADFNRYSILYLELLTRIKNEFLERGLIEEAMTFQKLINTENERLKGGKK